MYIYQDNLALARCTSLTKEEHRINWARLSWQAGEAAGFQSVTTLHCVEDRWIEFLHTTVVTSTNETRIAQSGRRILTSARHGLPLIIHSLWIAAMFCGVREEEFIARIKFIDLDPQKPARFPF
jgi:hypothetical protein